ncbi:hypothetical protein [Tahibacter sp.]|uniref:hypothetical protein n=1 Tax=Tahibacter sp. TaxID=2056211 RepID=UPI0028C3F849|nr:hypothetical protein [Tahibacter sp.]
MVSFVLAALLSACVPSPRPESAKVSTATAAPLASTPQQAFLLRLRSLCGKAFAGRIVADTPATADDPFAGKPLVMHVRECDGDTVRIPFHVGDDHSRTWVITLGDGHRVLRLKHEHRHADGSDDAMTLYGGNSRALPEAKPAEEMAGQWRFEFPADLYSMALFRAQHRTISISNVWAVELDAQRFVYELARTNRLFRVEFDLTQPQPLPPPPWGATAAH